MAYSMRPSRPVQKKTARFAEGDGQSKVYTIESSYSDASSDEPKPSLFSARVQRAAHLYEHDEDVSTCQIPSFVSVDDTTRKVIKYLKIWKKMYLVNIPSDALELLALHERRQIIGLLSVDELFRRCIGKLTCVHHIRIIYDRTYNSTRVRGAPYRGMIPYIKDPADPEKNILAGLNLRSVRMAGSRYFREFYENNPAERGRTRSRSRGRSASRSRSRARSRSRSRARSRSRGRSRSRSRSKSARRKNPYDMSSLLLGLHTINAGQPSSSADDEMPDFGENVKDLVLCLQQMSDPDSKYNVKEIIKGGSLGKGTATADSDIDLVVFFNGLDSIEDLKRARPKLLEMIRNELEESEFEDEIEWDEGTSYAVKFVLRDIEVDVLPAFDIVDKLGSPAAVYRAMERFPGGKTVAAQEFSASLAKLQRDFVKHAESCVKEAIKELKEWKDEYRVPIVSYCLELLAIYVHRQNVLLGRGSLFERCVRRLMDCERLQIAFDENYNSAKYTRSLKAPYILDPANPFRDTLERVKADIVSEKAHAYFRNKY